MVKKVCALLVLLSFSYTAYSQPVPFPCDGSFYQVFGTQGQSLAYDVQTDTSTIAPNSAGRSINAFGFNPDDGLGYGIFTGSTRLAQLDALGNVVDLGLINGLPAGNYPAGTIAEDGLYYAYSPNFLNTVYIININTVSVVGTLNIIGPTFATPDITFNPVDGRFYANTSNLGPPGTLNGGLLLAFDKDTGVLEIVGQNGLGPDGAFASMFSDASGNVYGQDRTDGGLYVFNTSIGTASQIGDTGINSMSVPKGGVDGFFCVVNPGPFAKFVPTLSEWGLIATAAILGIVSFIFIRRRKLAV